MNRPRPASLVAAQLSEIPDLEFEQIRLQIGEGHFVSEYVMSGTVNGNPFQCEGADVFTVRDGRIARKDTYLDGLEYARQTSAL